MLYTYFCFSLINLTLVICPINKMFISYLDLDLFYFNYTFLKKSHFSFVFQKDKNNTLKLMHLNVLKYMVSLIFLKIMMIFPGFFSEVVLLHPQQLSANVSVHDCQHHFAGNYFKCWFQPQGNILRLSQHLLNSNWLK